MKSTCIILIAIVLFSKAAYAQDNDVLQAYDYIINVQGSVVTAQPQAASGLSTYSGTDASVVIQNAINDISKGNGGSIHLTSGTYYLSNELTITGWDNDGPPNKQLILTGNGYATKLIQNTAGKNGIVIKNKASIILSGFYIFSGSDAKSGILLDDSGQNSDISVWGGTINNVFLQSGSTSSPAFYAKNFFNLNVPHLTAISNSNYGIYLENTSRDTNYGNSNFGIIIAGAGNAPPYAGLYITNSKSNGSHFLNLITFAHFECATGYRGIYVNGANFNTFSFVDIEGMQQPLYLDGSATTGETRICKFLSGYLYPAANGQAITCTLNTGGNEFDLFIEGDSSVTAVTDKSEYRPADTFNLTLAPGIDTAKIHIAWPGAIYNIKKNDGTTILKLPGAN